MLAEYGGGDIYPLSYKGVFADNGNYLEPDEIAVRHGVCGDPMQNAAEGDNVYSTPNIDWDVPAGAVFKSGGVIEINTVWNAWHWVRGRRLSVYYHVHTSWTICGHTHGSCFRGSVFDIYPVSPITYDTDPRVPVVRRDTSLVLCCFPPLLLPVY